MLAVLGDVSDAVLASESGGRVSDVEAGERHAPARRLPEADERLDQLALPVAFDAGHADDLAAVHGERDVVEDGPHLLDRPSDPRRRARPCR